MRYTSNVKENIIHRLKKNETLESVCAFYNVSVKDMKTINNINEIWEGMCLLIPEPNSVLYIVKPLDTIKKIAEEFNVSEEYIKEKNKILNVFIGQKIKI